jgi:hypothetical protein
VHSTIDFIPIHATTASSERQLTENHYARCLFFSREGKLMQHSANQIIHDQSFLAVQCMATRIAVKDISPPHIAKLAIPARVPPHPQSTSQER